MKALELNPNYAYGHLYYAGGYLTPLSRHAEAIGEVKKAVELDPLSTAINTYLGETYAFAGDYQKASDQFQHTIDMDPTFPLVHFFFTENLMAMGKYEQAVEEIQKGRLLNGAPPQQVAAETAETLKLLRTGGPKAYWQRRLQETMKLHGHGAAGPMAMAGSYAHAGDKEKAIEWLQKAYDERDDITLVGVDPDFKSLHGDPRFSALMKRMGLPG